MPDLSGLEFQQRLSEQRAAIPVIIITGHSDAPMAVSAMKAGASDFVRRPFRNQDLIDRIYRAAHT
jgi:FixJ family two-component response regulator